MSGACRGVRPTELVSPGDIELRTRHPDVVPAARAEHNIAGLPDESEQATVILLTDHEPEVVHEAIVEPADDLAIIGTCAGNRHRPHEGSTANRCHSPGIPFR
jgi:hypothetical protein